MSDELEKKTVGRPPKSNPTPTFNSPSEEDDEKGWLRKQVEALKEQVGLLTKVADKSRLSRFQKPEDQLIKIKISLWDGQVVTSWKLITNYVETRGTEVVEDQMVEYTLEGDKKVQMSYIDSVLKTQKTDVEVESVSTTKDGSKLYSVIYNGKTYSIDSKYIN